MPSAEPPNQAGCIKGSLAPSKAFSISLSTKAKPAISITKPPNPKKRPHSSLADDDSDREDGPQQPQLVSAFDHSAGGAISISGAEEKKEPLVIIGQKNRDWREESYRKKGKNLLPADVQAGKAAQAPQDGVTVERDEVSKEFGLSFVKRDVKDADGDVAMVESQKVQITSTADTEKPRDADQEALEALTNDGRRKSTLVLQASTINGERDVWTERVNEDDAFRSDVASRPDPASLDDYAAVPVEEFGAALLRGMGWKEGDVVGKRKNQMMKPRDVARRPALLGIGAKEVPGSVEELGAWGKAARGKRKVDKTYNPVLLKNSVTGEMLTEEELEAKKHDQKKEEQDWRERRDRNLANDEEKKSQRRLDGSHESRRRDYSKRDRSRSGERSRHSSSKRDRSRSIGTSRQSSSHRDKSRSQVSSRHSLSRRDRSRSSERKQSKRKDYNDYNDHERKDKDRRRRDRHDRYDSYDKHDLKDNDHRRKDKYDEREDYRPSKASHRRRDEQDDTPVRRKEAEVY